MPSKEVTFDFLKEKGNVAICGVLHEKIQSWGGIVGFRSNACASDWYRVKSILTVLMYD
jgi:hypothetical protein